MLWQLTVFSGLQKFSTFKVISNSIRIFYIFLPYLICPYHSLSTVNSYIFCLKRKQKLILLIRIGSKMIPLRVSPNCSKCKTLEWQEKTIVKPPLALYSVHFLSTTRKFGPASFIVKLFYKNLLTTHDNAQPPLMHGVQT